MRAIVVKKLISFAFAIVVGANANGQAPGIVPPNSEASIERPPSGMLTDAIGQLITIEGLSPDDAKLKKNGSARFQVDTVNGVKLEKPRKVRVGGLEIPRNIRCILKGYETGKMVGTPPAVTQAAEELGQKYIDGRQMAGYGWSTHFVVLIIVEPQALQTLSNITQ